MFLHPSSLRSGDLVYTRVAAASRDLEPQLSCVDALGRATVMGPLKVGEQTCIKQTTLLGSENIFVAPRHRCR